MTRPFMSSLGMSTVFVVASAVWEAEWRCNENKSILLRLLQRSAIFLMLQNDSAGFLNQFFIKLFQEPLTRLFFGEVQDLVQRFVLRVNFLELAFKEFLFLDFLASRR